MFVRLQASSSVPRSSTRNVQRHWICLQSPQSDRRHAHVPNNRHWLQSTQSHHRRRGWFTVL